MPFMKRLTIQANTNMIATTGTIDTTTTTVTTCISDQKNSEKSIEKFMETSSKGSFLVGQKQQWTIPLRFRKRKIYQISSIDGEMKPLKIPCLEIMREKKKSFACNKVTLTEVMNPSTSTLLTNNTIEIQSDLQKVDKINSKCVPLTKDNQQDKDHPTDIQELADQDHLLRDNFPSEASSSQYHSSLKKIPLIENHSSFFTPNNNPKIQSDYHDKNGLLSNAVLVVNEHSGKRSVQYESEIRLKRSSSIKSTRNQSSSLYAKSNSSDSPSFTTLSVKTSASSSSLSNPRPNYDLSLPLSKRKKGTDIFNVHTTQNDPATDGPSKMIPCHQMMMADGNMQKTFIKSSRDMILNVMNESQKYHYKRLTTLLDMESIYFPSSIEKSQTMNKENTTLNVESSMNHTNRTLKYTKLMPYQWQNMKECISDLINLLNFNEETFYVSIYFAQKFLSLYKTSTQADNLNLVALTCVYMAGKLLEEPHEPTVSLILEEARKSKLMSSKADSRRIARMERRIIQALDWRLNPVTPYALLDELANLPTDAKFHCDLITFLDSHIEYDVKEPIHTIKPSELLYRFIKRNWPLLEKCHFGEKSWSLLSMYLELDESKNMQFIHNISHP